MKSTITLVITLLVCKTVFTQAIKTIDGNNFKGATLTFLSQKCLPKDKIPYVGEDLIDFSDMNNRFRLENNGKEEIYFLASSISNSISPEGFVLFRKSKDIDWTSVYNPGRGREGVFSSKSTYRWLGLLPGSAIEFQYSGFSTSDGEHAASVILNSKPENKNRMELISNVFVTVPCAKAKR